MTNPYTPPASDIPAHRSSKDIINKASPSGMKIGMLVFVLAVSIPISILFVFLLVDTLRVEVIWDPEYIVRKFLVVIVLFCTQAGIAFIAGAHIGKQIEKHSFTKFLISLVIITFVWSLLFVLISSAIFNPGSQIINPIGKILNILGTSPVQFVLNLGMVWLILISISAFNSVIIWIVLGRKRTRR